MSRSGGSRQRDSVAFWNPRSYSQWYSSSNMATSLNMSQTILLTGDQTLKYTNLWGHPHLSHHNSVTFYYLACLKYSLYPSGHMTVSLGWEHHLWTRYKHCDAATPKDASSLIGRWFCVNILLLFQCTERRLWTYIVLRLCPSHRECSLVSVCFRRVQES